MKNVHTPDEYNTVARRLVELQISRVVYHEIEYPSGTPMFDRNDEIGHFLDFGLEIFGTNGASNCCIIWDSTFFPYGLGIYLEIPFSELFDSIAWNVTDHEAWRPLIGQSIKAVDSYWCIGGEDTTYFRTYPQDLRLQLSDGNRIYLSAAQYSDSSPQHLFRMSDEVVVIFSEDIAKQCEIGPWAPK